MPQQDGVPALESLRLRHVLRITLTGFGLILAVFGCAVWRMQLPSEIAAVVGTVSCLVGTVVGAFVGVQIGSSGTERAEMARKIAEEMALSLAASTDPSRAAEVMDALHKAQTLASRMMHG